MCTGVPWYMCPCVLVFLGTCVQMFPCTDVPGYRCFCVQVFVGTRSYQGLSCWSIDNKGGVAGSGRLALKVVGGERLASNIGGRRENGLVGDGR